MDEKKDEPNKKDEPIRCLCGGAFTVEDDGNALRRYCDKCGIAFDMASPTPEPPPKTIELKTDTDKHKPQHIIDLLWCPIRVGRVHDKESVITCGYEKTSLKQCSECPIPHRFDVNRMLNHQRTIKNSEDIRKILKTNEEQQKEIEMLKRTVSELVGQTGEIAQAKD